MLNWNDVGKLFMSAAFTGIKGVIVTVEIDITRGLPALNIVGLTDISVKESKEKYGPQY